MSGNLVLRIIQTIRQDLENKELSTEDVVNISIELLRLSAADQDSKEKEDNRLVQAYMKGDSEYIDTYQEQHYNLGEALSFLVNASSRNPAIFSPGVSSLITGPSINIAINPLIELQ